MYRLIDRPANCTGVHRSGWPHVMEAVRSLADPDAPLLLDDFVEQSMFYGKATYHNRPWVGIFHHPVHIDSPLRKDRRHALANVLRKAKRSLPNLVGAVVLAPGVGRFLEQKLGVPVLYLRHPTGIPTATWEFSPAVWQVGFFLRDTRLAYRLSVPPDWSVSRSRPYMHWMLERDAALAGRLSETRTVEEVDRLDDAAYDARMASSVVAGHMFGAAANNVIVECLIRHTPVMVNRLPEVAWYLGDDYPLFYDGQTPPPVCQAKAQAASRYLADRAADAAWLDRAAFAGALADFCRDVARSRGN